MIFPHLISAHPNLYLLLFYLHFFVFLLILTLVLIFPLSIYLILSIYLSLSLFYSLSPFNSYQFISYVLSQVLLNINLSQNRELALSHQYNRINLRSLQMSVELS